MLISVITPTYNRSKAVVRAVHSVQEQSYSDIEIFVVDDGSTDDTAEAIARIRDHRITYMYQENSGQSSARNRALREAKGDFVAFLDSDDAWPAEKLQQQVSVLRQYPNVDVLFGDRIDVSAVGTTYRKVGISESPSNLLKTLLYGNIVNFNSSIVRADLMKSLRFDETMRAGEDYDLWLRAAPTALFLYQSKPWLLYSLDGRRVSNDFEPVCRNNRLSISRVIARHSNKVNASEVNAVWCRFFARFAREYSRAGEFCKSIDYSCRAVWHAPYDLIGWRALAACVARRC